MHRSKRLFPASCLSAHEGLQRVSITYDSLGPFCPVQVMSNPTTVLPNPYTPMAFVSPELATKATIQTYSAVGSFAVSLIVMRSCIP